MGENIINNNSNSNNKLNKIKIFFDNIVFHFKELILAIENKDKLPTANEMYIHTTYGKNMTKEQFIVSYQNKLKELINERNSITHIYDDSYEAYNCFFELNRDGIMFENEIFGPFIAKGYRITKVSDKIDVLKKFNVYLISWGKQEDTFSFE